MLALLILFLLTTIGAKRAGEQISFSLSGGQRAAGDVIEIVNIPPYSIVRYTLDGSRVTADSAIYSQPFILPDTADVRGDATIIRAQRFAYNSPIGDEIVTTFFTGNALDGLTMPVVSLVVDPFDLYDYYHGIFTEGYHKTRWVAENPGLPFNWMSEANFTQSGSDWERDVHIELFDIDFTLMSAQTGGIRIAGNATRHHPNKSFRLRERGNSGPIYFPVFQDLHDHREQPLAQFTSFTLRNAGNDNGFCYIRDALGTQLGGQVGLASGAYRPVVVYLNGQYYGILNAREHVSSRSFLRAHFGVSNATILTTNIDDPTLHTGRQSDLHDFLALLQWVERTDFTRNAAVSELDRMLCVDNFARYFAIQIITGNIDWPHNNVIIWRGLGSGTAYGDGRWRFALHDLDVAFGQQIPFSWHDMLHHTLPRSVIFRQLLTNEQWKGNFIALVEELLATTFHPDHVIALANEMRLGLVPELPHFFASRERSHAANDIHWAALYDFIVKQPDYLARVFNYHLGVTLRTPWMPAPPLPVRDSYPFPHNSIVLGGVLVDGQTQVIDGVLSVWDNGLWVPVSAFAEARDLLYFIHIPTDSVIFSPRFLDAPR